MRIVNTKTNETIERPTDKALQGALAERICELKGIKRPK